MPGSMLQVLEYPKCSSKTLQMGVMFPYLIVSLVIVIMLLDKLYLYMYYLFLYYLSTQAMNRHAQMRVE